MDEMDCCSDEKKDYLIDIIEKIYNEGFERGCKEGYKKAEVEVLKYMKKRNVVNAALNVVNVALSVVNIALNVVNIAVVK